MKRQGWLGRGLLLASAVAASCVLVSPATYAADKTKVTVATDWSPAQGYHAALFLAKQKGWFDEAGLDVDIQDGKGSNATIQQVAAGQLDVGFAQLAAMSAAVSNGLPVISIMGLVRAGDNGLLVPADSGWTTLKDLKGKKIVVPSGSATATLLDAFLKAGGVSRSDFTFINVDSTAMVSTYSSGNADAALSTVAFFAPIVAETRPSKGILFKDVGLHVPGYGFVARKDKVTGAPDMLGKFVAAQQKAWNYIFAGHEEEAIQAIVALRPGARLDTKVMLGQLKAYMPLFTTEATKGKPLGWQAESDWVDALKAMREAGVVKADLPPSAFYTNQFVPGN